ncbi:MAG: FAD:protein FMN transferase [Dehalococcoidia bacterium]|nr:FAD:protein FMN transferase [Dehalococcoidia bacterium]
MPASKRTRVRRSAMFMDTTVTIEVAHRDEEPAALDAIERAMRWFERVEATCSRFDPESELRGLTAQAGVPVHVSALLIEPLAFALALAEETNGAFDPTVGGRLEAAGFDRNYRTGARAGAALESTEGSYRDVEIDRAASTVTLHRRLVLDLGAVAKGFAVDLAARELASFERVAVFAGGDVLVRAPAGEPYEIGIQHPRDPDALLAVLGLSEGAVCTSGDYQRTSAAGHHIVEPGTGQAVGGVVSTTVVAPTAMLADGLSTAAFVLGVPAGLRLVEANGGEGLLVTRDLERVMTSSFGRLAL